MLIPKQKKKELIDNPFRPKVGIPRTHTICKISWGEFRIEEHEVIERLRVDADHVEGFVEELETNIPAEDRHRHDDHEVWLVDRKWKKFLVDTAKKYFDETNLELRTW